MILAHGRHAMRSRGSGRRARAPYRLLVGVITILLAQIIGPRLGLPASITSGAQTAYASSGDAATPTTIASGEAHSIALRPDGTVWAFGSNFKFALGNGGNADSNAPVQVVGPGGAGYLSGITSVTAGGVHSATLRSDGTVWTWGDNSSGDLGDGTTIDRSQPVQVLGANGAGFLTSVAAIASGSNFTLALKADGTVWAWGSNINGQLGNGSFVESDTPVEVSGPGGSGVLTGAVSIGAGSGQSLAVRADGTAWTWGDNSSGQLGDGTAVTRTAPVEVLGVGGSGVLANVLRVAGGSAHSLALVSGGGVVAWGDGGSGQLGNGSMSSSSAPVTVIGLGAATAISASGYTSVAVSSSGVFDWGYNGDGQLGNGTASDSAIPVQVEGVGGTGLLSGITDVTEGDSHALALRNDGTLVGWGSDYYGQVGDGMNTYFGCQCHATPVVSLMTSVAQSGLPPGTPTSGPSGSEAYGMRGCLKADPVNCATGNFVEETTDLSIPGRGRRLELTRTYNALEASSALAPGPLGFGWSFVYGGRVVVDAGSGAATVFRGDGSTETFTPAAGSGYTAAAWVNSKLVKHPDGTFTFTTPEMLSEGFNAAGRLTQQSDRNGYLTAMAYDGSGHLTTVTDPSGRQLTLVWSSEHISQVTDPIGRVVRYGYDGAQNLTSVTDVGLAVTTFSYDSNHRIVAMTNPRGATTTNIYDAANRVTQQTDPLGRVTGFGYGAGGTTTITDPLGKVTVEKFVHNELVSVTQGYGTPLAAPSTYGYDAEDHVIQAKDPNGHASSATYDQQGNRLTSTDALGHMSSAAYSPTNDLLSSTDAEGLTTTYTYDGSGNLMTITRPYVESGQTATTTLSYSDPGHPGDVTAVTDPTDRTTSFGYDSFGNAVATVDGLGDKTSVAYNAIGWASQMVTARGNASGALPGAFTTTLIRDAYGMVTQVTDPLGHAVTTAYDVAHNPIQITDPDHNATRTTYDLDNEAVLVTRPDSTTSATQFNQAGLVAAQFDGLGAQTSYTYDALNHLASVSDSLGRMTRYTYDGAGNRLTLTDPSGRVTNMTHDAVNRLTSIAYSDGTTYGVLITYGAVGERTTMSDGTGNSSYSYDSWHRLTSNTSGAGLNVRYARDLAGRITSLTNPALATDTVTPVVARSYDAAGHLSTVRDWLGNLTSFGYDRDGNLTGEAYPNGLSAISTYDAAGRVVDIKNVHALTGVPILDSLAGVPILDFPSPRENDGLVWADSTTGASAPGLQTLPSPPDRRYGYDSNSRVTQVSLVTAPTSQYTYNAADEITQVQTGSVVGIDLGPRPVSCGPPLPSQCLSGATIALAGVSSLTYDRAGELTRLQTAVPAANATPHITFLQELLSSYTFAYDANGNRVASSNDLTGVGSQFKYDQANRLVDYAGRGAYAYDGDGLRASKAIGPTAETYSYDIAEGLPLILQDGNTRYVAGPGGLPLEQVSAAGFATYYHHDQLGSTRALTNQAGAVVSTYIYDPYGNNVGTPPTVLNPFQFAGQYLDVESGLYYLRARYYDPSTGQFISRDPAVASTRQPYAYASGNPVSRVDPSGLYDYSYVEDLGNLQTIGGEYSAMAYLQRHLGEVFPFSTGDCASVALNAECDLHPIPPQPFLAGHDSWVKIVDVQQLSFTFCSEDKTSGAHVAGPGGAITFSTFRRGDHAFLREVAHAPNATPVENAIDPLGAAYNWNWLANNLHNALADYFGEPR